MAKGAQWLCMQNLLALGQGPHFQKFHSPTLEDTDFDNKSLMFLVSQDCIGKSTSTQIDQDILGTYVELGSPL